MALRSAFLAPPLAPRGVILRTALPHVRPATARRPPIPRRIFLRHSRPHASQAESASISSSPSNATVSATAAPSSASSASSAPSPTTHSSTAATKPRYAPLPTDPLPPLPDVVRAEGEPMAPRYEPQAVEQALYAWWESAGLFRPADPSTTTAPPFTVCMPPPNVTGFLHMGHAMFATLEDILVRFHRMRGRPTLWLPGSDHAGIATQLVVEKALKAEEGVSRTELGREEFLKRVWQWKDEKGGYISRQIRRLGASCDWDRERFTLEPDMSSAVAEAFRRLYDAGLIYRGDYMVNWSPNLGTAVSDLEVDFVEENGKLYYFRYPLADGADDEFLPIATTRPETILGDTAVCVHPEDERYKHLIGRRAVVPIIGRDIPIIANEYVDREFGTGALKITPGHDHNDYTLGKKHSLDTINIMNKDATINSNGGSFEGLDRFEARKQLWEAMTEAGLVIRVEDHVNRVPRSQRGGEVIEPLVSTQWFVKMDSLAKDALDAVRDGRITIVPQRFEKVYFNWLEDIKDWCVSRQLWWGHRIPVWYVDEQQSEFVVARNEEEAQQIADERYGPGKTLTQEKDVLDTWFSSGLWPFSTMGWPQESNDDLRNFFPGAVMETGYDILFFWVARMIMMSMWLTGEIPFHTVYLHGLVRDKEGRKMSKSLGNVIDPIDSIEQYGTDALRYTLVTGSTPGQDIPLSNEKVEANRNFANKLWNASRFIIGNLEGIEEEERRYLAQIALNGVDDIQSSLDLPERYIVSKLHELVESVTDGLEKLSFGDVGRQIQDFLWDEFADWYVEISKTKMQDRSSESAQQARATLMYVMDTCLRLLHPFMPYVTETIWHRFSRDGSPERALIIAQWPKGGTVDTDSLRRFDRLQTLVRSIRNARAEYQVDAGKRIALTVRAEPVAAADVAAEKGMLSLLARVDIDQLNIEVVEQDTADEAEKDEQSLHLLVADGIEAVLPMRGMLDFEKELKRLNKQAEKVQKDLDGLNKRLNAPGFADKAPPAVVEQTRQSAAELEAQMATLSTRIADVEKMASE